MFKYSEVTGVHLEISSRCNAACPDCPRNYRGYDIEGEDYVVHDMSLAEAKKIFSVDFLRQLGGISINGNHGDFITCRDGLEIVKYFAQSNPNMHIGISTNASGQPKIWNELGTIPNLNVVFRIDGLRDTHSIYRQYTDFDRIIDNAKKYIAAGGYATWAMIKFDHNQHQIEQARAMSLEMGFRVFDLVDSGRSHMPVFDRQGNFIRVIGEPVNPITDIQEMIFLRKSNIENQGFANYYESTAPKKISCQAKRGRTIYVQSNGQVYPCCWIGFAPDTNFTRGGNEQTRALCRDNNALEVGLDRAIEWFSAIEQTWEIPTIKQGRHYVCNEECGNKN